MHFIFYYLRPFKSSEYLIKYFTTCRFILQGSNKSITQIRILQCILSLKSIHYVILYFTSTTDIQAFVIYDDAYIYKAQRQIMQQIFFAMDLMTIFFYEMIYLKPNMFLNLILEDIILRKRSKLFLNKPSNLKILKSIENLAKVMIQYTQLYMITIG